MSDSAAPQPQQQQRQRRDRRPPSAASPAPTDGASPTLSEGRSDQRQRRGPRQGSDSPAAGSKPEGGAQRGSVRPRTAGKDALVAAAPAPPARAPTSAEQQQAKEIAERQKFMGLDDGHAKETGDVKQYAQRLMDLIKGLDEHKAIMALSANDFNVEATAEKLLQGSSPTDLGWSDVLSGKQKVTTNFHRCSVILTL